MKKYVSYGISGIGILLCSFYLLITFTNVRIYCLDSAEMQPIIEKGSLLLSKKVEYEEIKIDDIITYKREVIPVYGTGRVVEKINENEHIYIKTEQEEKIHEISFEQYAGTMWIKIPWMGSVLAFFKSSIGRIISFIIIFVIFLYLGIQCLEKKKEV